MYVIIIIAAIIATVVITAYRADKLKKKNEEERRREEERLRARPAPPPAQRTQPAAQPVKREDPFAEYAENPYLKKDERATMTAAEYNEWLLDFVAAERAGAPRPKTRVSPYSRKLSYSGFSRRSVRKLRGFTPQNRLGKITCRNKIKPQNISTVLRNESYEFAPLAGKHSFTEYPAPQRSEFLPVKAKDKTLSATYVSFYKNAD